MEKLLDIEGVDEATASLLAAAGYMDVNAVLTNKPQKVYEEVLKANKRLQILQHEPSLEIVKGWYQGLIDENDESNIHSENKPNIYEPHIDAKQESNQILTALPLSIYIQEKKNIDLKNLPLVELAGRGNDKKLLIEPSNHLEKVDKVLVHSDLNSNQFDSKGSEFSYLQSEQAATHITKSLANDKALRGVLHREALVTYLGAWGQIVACLLLLLALLLIVYIVINPKNYIIAWFIPLLLFLSLCVYVFFARKSSCPVCRQRQFVAKSCRKHEKAHSSRFLGNMLPTAFHMVKHKWFRCLFCGTAIRLKDK